MTEERPAPHSQPEPGGNLSARIVRADLLRATEEALADTDWLEQRIRERLTLHQPEPDEADAPQEE